MNKEELINKLQTTEEVLKKILTEDKNAIVISFEDQDRLQSLQNRNENILHKLKTDEFSVAIVGLEKAGKSTVGNALIKMAILPEYTERCTYTTTEIRSGDRDEAIISFYKHEQFNKNFQDMMNILEFPGESDFFHANLDEFKNFLETIKNDPNKQNVLNDVVTMLEGRNQIRQLLNKPNEIFDLSSDSESERQKMKRYITGFEGYNEDKTAKRDNYGAYPYAVERVVIHSTKLNEMSHIVLYDVPGFDSPTELHKKQTELMLSKADAIILVTNIAANPRLTGTQLEMLKKIHDDDGIRLIEKAFIFGNRLDQAGNENRAEGNIASLRRDAKDNQITVNDRVICGSAKAFLEKNKIFSEDDIVRGLTNADKTLDNWSTDYTANDYGIAEIKKKLKFYHDRERLQILQKRVDATIEAIKNILTEILNKYKIDGSDRINNSDKLFGQVLRKIQRPFVREMNIISGEHQRKINSEKPFSQWLNDNIEKIYPYIDENDSLIFDVENEGSIDTSGIYPVTGVDVKIREKMNKQFMKNLVEYSASITLQMQSEIRNQLVEKFLEIIGVDQNSKYHSELKELVNKLFDEFLIENGAKCYFNPLVERFSMGLIETLILMPFASEERFDKVEKNLPEFLSLAVYYTLESNSEGAPSISDDPNERLKFFSKIFVHDEIQNSEDESRSTELLKKFFDEELKISIDDSIINDWTKKYLIKFDLSEGLPQNLIEILLQNSQTPKWSASNDKMRIEWIEKTIRSYCNSPKSLEFQKNISGSRNDQRINLTQKIKELHNLSKNVDPIKNRTDIIRILNEDILILRDITKNAIIKATGLETAFNAVITKNINLISSNLKAEENDLLDAWVSENLPKIKESEYTAIERQNLNLQVRRSIINSIHLALKELH